MASTLMSMRRRGIMRLARRKAERRLGVLGSMESGSAGFPMERVTLQERVVFFLFQPVRRVGTFFIARGGVARWWFAFGFCLGAFQRDNFLWHDGMVWVKWSGGRMGECIRKSTPYSLLSKDGSSSSDSPSSSERPKSEVTDWRAREPRFCFSSCAWHSTV